MSNASARGLRLSLQAIISALNIHTLLPMILLLVMLPHLFTTPVLLTLFILLILLWFSLHTLGLIALPGTFIRFLLIIICLVLTIFNYGFHVTQKASITLLCLMVCLKLLEIKHESDRRNIFVVLFLGYFILITHFLYSQGLVLTLFTVIMVFSLTLLLQGFTRLPQYSMKFSQQLNILLKIFLKALPITILLFLFFPRIPGPLWSLPDDGNQASTGLSDTMYPGSVTDLADSDEIAFRVDFQNSPPAAEKLYWRGPVLTETDGILWSQTKPERLQQSVEQIVRHKKNPTSYTVTLEPHQQKWLFTLEMPFQVEGDTIKGFHLTKDLLMENRTAINQLTQYRVTSYSDFYLAAVSPHEIDRGLKLSATANPRTRELGRQWLEEFEFNNSNSEQTMDRYPLVAKALDYFRDEDFFYTKKPDSMKEDPADQFLFDKKRGFCEHFASSFVILMRAAGIPARVVTGYQGIEKNQTGDYYLVRQSNAHAWAEVWLDKSGWIRVDPTSVIPPERIEADIFDTDLERLTYSSLTIFNLPELSEQQKTALYKFSRQVNQYIDNIKYNWNNWILGYDQNKQNLLLTLMGLSASWQTLIVMLIGGMAFTAMVLYLYYNYQRYRQIDRVYLYYEKFLCKLDKAGLTINNYQGPEEVKRLAMEKFPQSEKRIQELMQNYIVLRYGCLSAKESRISSFKTQVKQLLL